jgi:hypothetical protein
MEEKIEKINKFTEFNKPEIISQSYSKREMTLSFFDTFDLLFEGTEKKIKNRRTITIQGVKMSCGINFFHGLEQIVESCASLRRNKELSKIEDLEIILFKKIIKKIKEEENTKEFKGIGSKFLPKALVLSHTENFKIREKNFLKNLRKNSLKGFGNSSFNCFHNPNSHNEIFIIILDTEKLLNNEEILDI